MWRHRTVTASSPCPPWPTGNAISPRPSPQRLPSRSSRSWPPTSAPTRTAQPNYILLLDKAGIDPFTDRYPLRLVLKGTVRGTGGLQLVSDECETTVPGLFAAGDAATRVLVTGAISGGGSHNGAWAISSGTWAGAGAARHALAGGLRGASRPGGTMGLRPSAP